MGWRFDGSVGIEQFWWGILDKNNIHSFHLCMISGNHDEAWPMYLAWPISERFMLGRYGGTWHACCHWPNTGRVDGRCPIMSVLTQSYQCGTWFVWSTLPELAVCNLGQLLFCLTITWSRCRNAYRDLWIMTINWACYPGGHYWIYYPGALCLSQVTATHLRLGTFRFLLRVPNL